MTGSPAGTGLGPAPSRGLVEAERRLIAMANEIGVDVRDPVALMALIEATLEQFINATGRRNEIAGCPGRALTFADSARTKATAAEAVTGRAWGAWNGEIARP